MPYDDLDPLRLEKLHDQTATSAGDQICLSLRQRKAMDVSSHSITIEACTDIVITIIEVTRSSIVSCLHLASSGEERTINVVKQTLILIAVGH